MKKGTEYQQSDVQQTTPRRASNSHCDAAKAADLLESLDDCFQSSMCSPQGQSFSSYFANIDEHINLRIAAGIKKGLTLVLQRLDGLVNSKVELALKRQVPAIVEAAMDKGSRHNKQEKPQPSKASDCTPQTARPSTKMSAKERKPQPPLSERSAERVKKADSMSKTQQQTKAQVNKAKARASLQVAGSKNPLSKAKTNVGLAKELDNKHGLMHPIKVIKKPILSNKEEPKSPKNSKKVADAKTIGTFDEKPSPSLSFKGSASIEPSSQEVIDKGPSPQLLTGRQSTARPLPGQKQQDQQPKNVLLPSSSTIMKRARKDKQYQRAVLNKQQTVSLKFNPGVQKVAQSKQNGGKPETEQKTEQQLTKSAEIFQQNFVDTPKRQGHQNQFVNSPTIRTEAPARKAGQTTEQDNIYSVSPIINQQETEGIINGVLQGAQGERGAKRENGVPDGKVADVKEVLPGGAETKNEAKTAQRVQIPREAGLPRPDNKWTSPPQNEQAKKKKEEAYPEAQREDGPHPKLRKADSSVDSAEKRDQCRPPEHIFGKPIKKGSTKAGQETADERASTATERTQVCRVRNADIDYLGAETVIDRLSVHSQYTKQLLDTVDQRLSIASFKSSEVSNQTMADKLNKVNYFQMKEENGVELQGGKSCKRIPKDLAQRQSVDVTQIKAKPEDTMVASPVRQRRSAQSFAI